MTARRIAAGNIRPMRRRVQGAIEDAIARFDGERVTIQGAGRTDAGVHALGQVAHCDLRSEHDGGTVRDALNFYLRPQPVAILAAERVGDDFDARFSATQAALSLSHRQPAARSRARSRPRLAGGAAARYRGDARGGDSG